MYSMCSVKSAPQLNSQPIKPHRKIDSQSLLQQQGAHSGWLRRQNVFKKWSKKFTVIYRCYVYSFKNETSSKPKSYFSLHGYESVIETKEQSELWIFKIVHSDKKQIKYFAAASPSEYELWIRRFTVEIQFAKAIKHDYFNCYGLQSSDFHTDRMYDDIGVYSEHGYRSASPLLTPASSCQSLPLLYAQVRGTQHRQQINQGRRPLPLLPDTTIAEHESTYIGRRPLPLLPDTTIAEHESTYIGLSEVKDRSSDPVTNPHSQQEEIEDKKPVFTLRPPPEPSKSNRHKCDKKVQEYQVKSDSDIYIDPDGESSDEDIYNVLEKSDESMTGIYEDYDGIGIKEEQQRVTSSSDTCVVRLDKSHDVLYTVISKYEYTAKDDSELSFKEEEKFSVIGFESKRWLIGYLNGKVGLFPAEFVEKIKFKIEVKDYYTALVSEQKTNDYDHLYSHDTCDDKLVSDTKLDKTRVKKRESIYTKIGTTSRIYNTSEKMIPQQLRRMDKTSVNIYQTCMQRGTERRNKVRIIVVGPRKTGKTCLIRRLLRKVVTDVERTCGVEVHILKCKAKLRDRRWICHEESTILDNVNARLLKAIIETTKNLQEDEKNENESACYPERKISNENDKWIPTYHITESSGIKSNVIESTENNYDEDLRDLGEILKAPFDEDDTVEIDLWDFAGDKEYYNTHKAFLSKDAIYLVTLNVAENVTDITTEDSRYDLKYWLETIRCYGKIESGNAETEYHDPPVFIIGTHKDMFKGSNEECYEQLIHEVGKAVENEITRKHVRKYYLVSCTKDSDENFEELRTDILGVAERTSNWNKELPIKWIRLEKALLQETRSGQFILSIDQIRDLAASTNHPITDLREIASFLLYHHDIGTYIYFKDLPEYVVLYPQWLADAFKSIVSADNFGIGVSILKEWEHFRKSGRLSEKLSDHLFLKQSPEIRENKGHILQVMEKFDIIVRPRVMLQSLKVVQEPNYFVPCMMQTKHLREIVGSFPCKSKSSWLCLEFDFLPPPLITCLLVTYSREWSVATLPHIKSGNEPIFYRDFALFHLEDDEVEMLLIASVKNIIEIQVWKWGEQKRPYLKLRKDFDSLLQRLRRLFQMNISYKTNVKCSSAEFDSFGGMVEIEDILQKSKFFCKHHNDVHSTDEMHTDWIVEEIDRCLTKEQINAMRLSIITLSVLTDILYDRLCLDSSTLRNRSECDVSYLYAELRGHGRNLPTKGTFGGKLKDIKDVHKKIGDDIERIRLIRNEIQHLSSFSISHDRFIDIRRMCQAVAKRMELHNKKDTTYTDGITIVLQKEISSQQAEVIKMEIMSENPSLHISKTSYKVEKGEGCTLECQVLVPIPDGATVLWFKGEDDTRKNIKEDPNWNTKYKGGSIEFPSLIILSCDESDADFYSSEIKYPKDSAEYDYDVKIKWPFTYLHVSEKTMKS